METTFIIPDIPLYRGQLPNGSRKLSVTETRDYERALAKSVTEELVRQNCANIMGISRASYFAMLVAHEYQKIHRPVDSIVIVPAIADVRKDFSAKGPHVEDAMDGVLRSLTIGMEEETYQQMKKRHEPTFMPALKAMDPKKHIVTVEEAHDALQAIHPATRILVIDCLEDPFRDRVRLAQVIGSRPNVTISAEIESGHFPHIQTPKDMAAEIRTWKNQS
jgi:hypothetical protein